MKDGVLKATIVAVISSVAGGVAWLAVEPAAQQTLAPFVGGKDDEAARAKVVSLPVNPDARPSFDCVDATSAIEKLICSDTGLAEADLALARLWESLDRRGLITDDIRNSQRGWISRRDGCLIEDEPVACARKAMRERIAYLGGL